MTVNPDVRARLKALVARRRRGDKSGFEADARVVVASVIDTFGTDPTDDHAVPWNALSWIAADPWTRPWRDRVEGLAYQVGWKEDGRQTVRISRSMVFDRNAHDPEDLFLAALVWGFGTTGYGWRRTSKIIAAAGERRIRDAVVTVGEAASDGPKTAWSAWSPGGDAKLHHLGTAFASKVAYFRAYDRSTATGPLIADLNTAWSLWALTGIWDSRYNATCYQEYVDWCTHIATELSHQDARGHVRSDDIERALFELGPMARSAWRS